MGGIYLGELPLAPSGARADVSHHLPIFRGKGAGGRLEYVVINGWCVGGVGSLWVGGVVSCSLGHAMPKRFNQLPWQGLEGMADLVDLLDDKGVGNGGTHCMESSE